MSKFFADIEQMIRDLDKADGQGVGGYVEKTVDRMLSHPQHIILHQVLTCGDTQCSVGTSMGGNHSNKTHITLARGSEVPLQQALHNLKRVKTFFETGWQKRANSDKHVLLSSPDETGVVPLDVPGIVGYSLPESDEIITVVRKEGELLEGRQALSVLQNTPYHKRGELVSGVQLNSKQMADLEVAMDITVAAKGISR